MNRKIVKNAGWSGKFLEYFKFKDPLAFLSFKRFCELLWAKIIMKELIGINRENKANNLYIQYCNRIIDNIFYKVFSYATKSYNPPPLFFFLKKRYFASIRGYNQRCFNNTKSWYSKQKHAIKYADTVILPFFKNL